MQQPMVKRFFLRALLFSLPVLATMLTLEMLQHSLPNNYKKKKTLLENGTNDWEVLILGNSHSYLGINPKYLSGKAFNLGFTAQTLYFDKFLLEKYLDQLPKLRHVIVPVSYSSLGSESYRNPGIYDKSYHYAHFYGSKAYVKLLAPRRYSLVSLFTFRQSLERSWDYYMESDSLVEFGPNGWYDTQAQWKHGARDLDQNGKNAGQMHDAFYHEDLIPANLKYLEEMIELCRAHGVKLHFISTPLWKSYLAHIKPERHSHMVQAMDSLSQVHQVSYHNFTEDPRFGENDFFDSNHLNHIGSEKFTQILDSLLHPMPLATKPVH